MLTDIEGSTRLWELRTSAMDRALERHNAILDDVFSASGGLVVTSRGEGDSVFAVFQNARQAILAAVDAQRLLGNEPWPEGILVNVRMALHTGEAELRQGEYHGHAAINRCGRLRALAHGGQVLISGTTRDLVYHHLPDGIGLKSLGEQKLRDIDLPEHIFQVTNADLREDFPPLKTIPRTASNLPEQLTTFVGREREAAEVRTLLERARLVTVTGAAGAGKTRLALKVAGELLGAYDDGVCFIELAPLGDPALVPQALATAMSLVPSSGRSHESVLLETLRDQRRLLVLDNCEHLINACARMTEVLLKACPRIRVLATSREALGVPGEISWRVPPLVPSEGARLFQDRAALARPGFALDQEGLATIESICQRLDGIPLAIELAAARVRVMPPEEILKRLEHRFRLLTGGSRTALERHQTLRAAVDWSYALLDEPEKLLFRSLSVFSGSFTREAAAGVAPGGLDEYGVMDALARLVDKSLLVEDGPVGRYRMLETLRQYGHERLLESEGLNELRGRHLEYYLALAEDSGRQHPELLGRDLDNFRIALDWSLDADGDRGLRLITALAWLFTASGITGEGRARLMRLLETVPEVGRVRAWGLYEAGWFAWWQGDAQPALAYFRESAAAAKQLGDRRLLGRALQGAGTTAAAASGEMTDDPHVAPAHEFLVEALAIFREDGDIEGQASCLQTLGFEALRLGDPIRAREMLEAGLELRVFAPSDSDTSAALGTLGLIALRSEDFESARHYLTQAVDASRRAGNRPGLALGLGAAMTYASSHGNLEVAVVYGTVAEATYKQLGMDRFFNLSNSDTPAARFATEAEGVYAAAREKLGEAKLAELQARGRSMTLDEALDDAWRLLNSPA